jgi:hypothetical protein
MYEKYKYYPSRGDGKTAQPFADKYNDFLSWVETLPEKERVCHVNFFRNNLDEILKGEKSLDELFDAPYEK